MNKKDKQHRWKINPEWLKATERDSFFMPISFDPARYKKLKVGPKPKTID